MAAEASSDKTVSLRRVPIHMRRPRGSPRPRAAPVPRMKSELVYGLCWRQAAAYARAHPDSEYVEGRRGSRPHSRRARLV